MAPPSSDAALSLKLAPALTLRVAPDQFMIAPPNGAAFCPAVVPLPNVVWEMVAVPVLKTAPPYCATVLPWKLLLPWTMSVPLLQIAPPPSYQAPVAVEVLPVK